MNLRKKASSEIAAATFSPRPTDPTTKGMWGPPKTAVSVTAATPTAITRPRLRGAGPSTETAAETDRTNRTA